jgi:adenine/guanine phosphoribosyltransferase-like PRPP-binding protein
MRDTTIKELIASFNNQPIVKKNGRKYLIIPMTDHYQATEPIILRQAVNAICDITNWNGPTPINKVVSEEERGGFIAVCVALQRNLPFSLAKQNPVHLKGEIGINFSMDYNESMNLYLNGVGRGDRVIIIDDIIATGGTMISMIQAVRKAGVEIREVIGLSEKIELAGVDRMKKETGIEVKTILKLDTSGKKSRVVSTIFD